MSRRPDGRWARAVLLALVATASAPAVTSADRAKDAEPVRALGHAALYGDIEAVSRLLGQGADVNAIWGADMTPLMWAFQPLIRPSARSGPDPHAFQAFRARQARKLRIARMLIERGADVRLKDRHGMTALHQLVLMHGEDRALLETLQALVETGANADVPNNDDLTPLMFAADRNRLKFVKFLVSAGADPRAAAKDGRTALSIARERGHAQVAAFLERQLRERSRPR